MSVLVDTSIWVDYFRSGSNSEKLDFLIDENLIATNDWILTELIPPLKMHKQEKLIALLLNIYRYDLSINWNQIIEYQRKCFSHGLNGIGIPNLIIAQNAEQHHCEIYSLDHHFRLMKDVLNLQVM